jgi:uncharacterized cupin superfamily protein
MACYVLEGTMAWKFGDETQDFGPGSFIYVPAGTAYQYTTSGDTPAKYLLLCTPGGFEEYIAEVSDWVQRQSTWPPTNMSEVAALRARAHFYDAPAS